MDHNQPVQRAFKSENVSDGASDAQDDSDDDAISENLENETTEAFTGYKCDSCEYDIFGFRYICVQCVLYNLCVDCEALMEHAYHYMLRIPSGKSNTETVRVLERIRANLSFIEQPKDELDDNNVESCPPFEMVSENVIEYGNNKMEIGSEKCTTELEQTPGQSTQARSNKGPKTSAERGREYRARKALLRQQSKQKDSIEDDPPVSPSQKRIERRAKAAEARRRRRERERGVREKKQSKTAAERMREYRQRKKMRKKMLQQQNMQHYSDSTENTSIGETEKTDSLETNSISAEGTRSVEVESGVSQPWRQQPKTAAEHMQEYYERRKVATNIGPYMSMEALDIKQDPLPYSYPAEDMYNIIVPDPVPRSLLLNPKRSDTRTVLKRKKETKEDNPEFQPKAMRTTHAPVYESIANTTCSYDRKIEIEIKEEPIDTEHNRSYAASPIAVASSSSVVPVSYIQVPPIKLEPNEVEVPDINSYSHSFTFNSKIS